MEKHSQKSCTVADKLQGLCDQLDFEVSQHIQHKLLVFLQQLQKWNKAYNLTAISSEDKMLTHHLLDSLAIAPFIEAKKIADVGTGAGIPGIPLAILYPKKQFLLIDSNGKKIRFIRQMIHQLGLKNVIALHKRVESVEEKVDVVITRAFASLRDMVQATYSLLKPEGCFIAMKGKHPQQEIDAVADKAIVVIDKKIQVPGLEAERHLIRLKLKQPD